MQLYSGGGPVSVQWDAHKDLVGNHEKMCGMTDPTATPTDEQAKCVADAALSGDSIWIVIIKAVIVLVFLLLSVLFAVWFERRVIGRLQQRPGPNVHGPFGLFQPLQDALKLVFKEDITVRAAEKLVYIADRRGGMEILSVEDRARETGERHPRFAAEIGRAIPIALAIEREVFSGLPFAPADLASRVAVPS